MTPRRHPGNFWIGVVSGTHVKLGVKGGFVQLNHGKMAPLKRMNTGDGIVIYSPRTAYPGGEPLQRFTAIGFVIRGDVYQAEMTPDFKPYRVDVRFLKCHEAPIKPLIDRLSFITNKTKWGAPFRFGHLKITHEDFLIIAKAMGVAQDMVENMLEFGVRA